MSNLQIVVGIPARMASSRFPGKPMCRINGLTMIEHVYRRCSLSEIVDQVFIATCDEEIRSEVESFGGVAIMTDPDISRPGLRVAEACKQLELADDDIVVVVQGDEALMHPDMLDLAVKPLLVDSSIFCVNLAGDLEDEHWQDANEIKVVCDLQMNALYMSRSAIPSSFHPEKLRTESNVTGGRYRQVCVFPFRKADLLAFNELSVTPLELAESVEMLRAIEHGRTVRMVYSPFATKSVDTEDDRRAVEILMADDPIYKRYGS